jgi:hypothetical protein
VHSAVDSSIQGIKFEMDSSNQSVSACAQCVCRYVKCTELNLISPLKGQCQKMDIFCRSKHFNKTFCVCADGFQDLSKAFHYRTLNY